MPTVHDGLVVASAELAPIIQQAINEFNADHDWEADQFHAGKGNDKVSSFGAMNWLEFETGLNQRSIYRILTGESKFTTLERADKILSALDKTQALSNGEVHIVPNPYWSQEHWNEWAADRGCSPDDLLT